MKGGREAERRRVATPIQVLLYIQTRQTGRRSDGRTCGQAGGRTDGQADERCAPTDERSGRETLTAIARH